MQYLNSNLQYALEHPNVEVMKQFGFALIFGFLLGATFTGLFSPSMIAWYFDPPAAIGISCKDAVVWGIDAYQKLLLIGGSIGLLLAAFFVVARRSKPNTPPVNPSIKPNV